MIFDLIVQFISDISRGLSFVLTVLFLASFIHDFAISAVRDITLMQMNLQCAVHMGSLKIANKIIKTEIQEWCAICDEQCGCDGMKSESKSNSSALIL